MFPEAEFLDVFLDFFPFPVDVVQALDWRIPGKPEDILGKLALPPAGNVLEGFGIGDLLAGHPASLLTENWPSN